MHDSSVVPVALHVHVIARKAIPNTATICYLPHTNKSHTCAIHTRVQRSRHTAARHTVHSVQIRDIHIGYVYLCGMFAPRACVCVCVQALCITWCYILSLMYTANCVYCLWNTRAFTHRLLAAHTQPPQYNNKYAATFHLNRVRAPRYELALPR